MSTTATPRKKLRFRTDFSPASRIEDVLDEPDGRPAAKAPVDTANKASPLREHPTTLTGNANIN